jgi:hypothetical protein
VVICRYSDGLRVGRPGFDSRQGQDFSPLHNVRTGSDAHPAADSRDTRSDCPGGKAAEA